MSVSQISRKALKQDESVSNYHFLHGNYFIIEVIALFISSITFPLHILRRSRHIWMASWRSAKNFFRWTQCFNPLFLVEDLYYRSIVPLLWWILLEGSSGIDFNARSKSSITGMMERKILNPPFSFVPFSLATSFFIIVELENKTE